MTIRPASQTQITICIHLWEKILRLKDASNVFPNSTTSMYKCTHAYTHAQRGLWAGVFSGQTSESGSSELNFHVVLGPGELVYRAKNEPRSFNYRLSVASVCSYQFKWKVGWSGRWHRGQRASTWSCCNRFMHRFETPLVAVFFFISWPSMQMWTTQWFRK